MSIHTIAAAAYQIIYDINQFRKTDHEAIYNTLVIKDEYRKQWIGSIKAPINFFKHADKDPEGRIVFSPFGNLVFFMSAMSGLAHLNLVASDFVIAFMMWIQINEPSLIKEEARQAFAKNVPVEGIDWLRKLSKAEFLKEALSVLQRRGEFFS